MSESSFYGTPVTDWMTPPAPESDSGQYSMTSSVSKSTLSYSKPESVDFLIKQLKCSHLGDHGVAVRCEGERKMSEHVDPVFGNETSSRPSSQRRYTRSVKNEAPPSTVMSHHQVFSSHPQVSSKDSHQYSSSRDIMRSVDGQRSVGNESPSLRDHRSPSRPPPKAIVTPLMGVVHGRSHTTSASQKSYTTNQTYIKKVTGDTTAQAGSDVESWKTLLEKKDNILIQKTDLIERQKQSIANLQLQLKEKDTHLSAVTELCRKNVPPPSARHKELECENTSLKAQLTAVTNEFHRLSAKVSAVEVESALDKRSQGRLNSVQLADYNTAMEERRALKQQVDEVSLSYKRLSEAHNAKDREIHQLKVELSDNTLALKALREKCQCLDDELATLQTEKEKLVTECKKLQRLLFEGEANNRRDLQAMRERHKQRFVDATAQLRSRHKTMAKRVRALEIQLSRNSDVISALNDEVQMNHGTIGDLKLSVKDLLSQNQHLVEQNLSLQESTVRDHATRSPSDMTDTKVQQLTSELVHCVEDFESLVALCSSLLQGCDPSASLIFGVDDDKGATEATAASDVELTLDCSVGDKLVQVKRLKTKVDQLRELVSEQFASQVSNTCHVQ